MRTNALSFSKAFAGRLALMKAFGKLLLKEIIVEQTVDGGAKLNGDTNAVEILTRVRFVELSDAKKAKQ